MPYGSFGDLEVWKKVYRFKIFTLMLYSSEHCRYNKKSSSRNLKLNT